MKRTKKRKRRVGGLIALALMLMIGIFAGVMALNASTLHLMRATVALPDLPPAFEGTTILYAADIDLGGINGPNRAAEVFRRLQVLNPDLLLLGGDYTAPTLGDLINQSPVPQYASNAADLRRDFFYYIRDFQTTFGKYMIAAPDDRQAGDLRALAEETGFNLLDDGAAEVRLGADSLWVVGLGDDASGSSRLSRHFNSGDCVIAMIHSPGLFPAMMTAEAADSGHWVDLTLAGHNHGGQIRLFGRSILSLDTMEQRNLYGWNRETGVPLLTTSGVGCEGINLRLGSQAEIWLITLTRGLNGE